MKIGFVGHHTWFENHFIENWQKRPDVLCLDVDEKDYVFLTKLVNFQPEITIFYRPELYPRRYLKSISGKKVAFLSEPIPDNLNFSSVEGNLRDSVYKQMNWDCFDYKIYYDQGKRQASLDRQWPINEYRPIPINTSVFKIKSTSKSRAIDVIFIGKPTLKRITQLDFLRSMDVNFVWVAHGVSGKCLAALFNQSKIALNIHADDMGSFEPRIYLGASCGCTVLTDKLSYQGDFFNQNILEYEGNLTEELILKALKHHHSSKYLNNSEDHISLSTETLLKEIMTKL